MTAAPGAPGGSPASRPVDAALVVLAERLAHPFADGSLLSLAVTHRSWCAEHPGTDSNERLEFLGDAVLGLVVTDHLFRTYPELAEGEMAKARAWVVSEPSLAQAATALDLGSALRLNKGEHKSGGRQKPSILADSVEAVIGAVFLDGGLEAARRLVLDLLGARIAEAVEGSGGHDHKTRLQELATRLWDELPVYDLRSEGPDHDPRFFAAVSIGGVRRGQGEGRSKKQAEQAAARAAWDRLVIELGDDPGGTVAVGRAAGEGRGDA